ncbi:hypothetical protein FRC10_007782 [Ceratobasidium sp. 414]|nr:hypothetical protein FRC10_007782 [Ceratobasidium sp. 414]
MLTSWERRWSVPMGYPHWARFILVVRSHLALEVKHVLGLAELLGPPFSPLTTTQWGVGNRKAILNDPRFVFQSCSPVDLKDRFRTYFPDAYRLHYPNVKTHLSSRVRLTLPDRSKNFCRVNPPSSYTHPCVKP